MQLCSAQASAAAAHAKAGEGDSSAVCVSPMVMYLLGERDSVYVKVQQGPSTKEGLLTSTVMQFCSGKAVTAAALRAEAGRGRQHHRAREPHGHAPASRVLHRAPGAHEACFGIPRPPAQHPQPAQVSQV